MTDPVKEGTFRTVQAKTEVNNKKQQADCPQILKLFKRRQHKSTKCLTREKRPALKLKKGQGIAYRSKRPQSVAGDKPGKEEKFRIVRIY